LNPRHADYDSAALTSWATPPNKISLKRPAPHLAGIYSAKTGEEIIRYPYLNQWKILQKFMW